MIRGQVSYKAGKDAVNFDDKFAKFGEDHTTAKSRNDEVQTYINNTHT